MSTAASWHAPASMKSLTRSFGAVGIAAVVFALSACGTADDDLDPISDEWTTSSSARATSSTEASTTTAGPTASEESDTPEPTTASQAEEPTDDVARAGFADLGVADAPDPDPVYVAPEPAYEPPAPANEAPAAVGGFANCSEARAAGYSDIPIGSPAYSSKLDRNNDGVACES